MARVTTSELQEGLDRVNANLEIIIERQEALINKQHQLIKYILHRFAGVDRKLDAIADENSSFAEILVDLCEKLNTNKVEEDAKPIIVSSGKIPVVAVAGLRGQQETHLKSAIGDKAKILFVDSRKVNPDQIAADHIIMTKWIGENWRKQAMHIFRNKYTVVNGTSGIVKQVSRLKSEV